MSYYRHPRTTQERRFHQEEWVEGRYWIPACPDCEGHWEEYGGWVEASSEFAGKVHVPIRGSRKPNHIPNAWDDIPRRDVDDRSWKRYRRTQYKVVNKFPVPKKSSRRYAKHAARRDHWHFMSFCSLFILI